MKKYRYFFIAVILFVFTTCYIGFLGQEYNLMVLPVILLLSILVSVLFLFQIKNGQRIHSVGEEFQYDDKLKSEYEKLYSDHKDLEAKYKKAVAAYNEHNNATERLQNLFNSYHEALWEYDLKKREWHLSDNILKIYKLDSVWARNNTNIIFDNLIHPDDKYYVLKLVMKIVRGQIKNFSVEFRTLMDNQYFWVRARGVVFSDSSGKPYWIFGSFFDIRKEKAKEEKILEMACLDPVTGLPNRLWLINYLETQVESIHPFALIYMDMDNFGMINDIFGCKFGDQMLKTIGIRLKNFSGNESVVCRISGDKFAILITDTEIVNRYIQFAEKLKEKLQEPIKVNENSFHFTFSLGIAIYPKDGRFGNDLMKNADTAMARAKSNGKNQWIRFEKRMNDELYEKMALEMELRRATEKEEFRLFYQPQVAVGNHGITGVEALIRWNHPKLGWIMPGDFIPLAEERGLINRIGEWVFRTACEFSAKINKNRIVLIPVAVNVSPVQLVQHDFLSRFLGILEETGVCPESMAIEITESALMESYEESVLKLKALKKKGIRIALDDFGTGYSSIQCLRELPVDILKIDRSFIKDIARMGTGRKITEAMIFLAHRLDMNVVAEGVEEIEQCRILEQYSCDIAQGYYFSKPIPEESMIEYIRRNYKAVSRAMI